MRDIRVDDLKIVSKAPEDLYLKRGQKVFDKGEKLPLGSLETIEKLGVTSLVAVGEKELDAFRFKAAHQELSLDSQVLKQEGQLSQALYTKDGELVLQQGQVWTLDLAQRLRKRRITSVFLRRSEEKIKEDQQRAKQLLAQIDNLRSEKKEEAPKKDPEPKSDDSVDLVLENFDKLDQKCFTSSGLDSLTSLSDSSSVPDEANALKNQLQSTSPLEMREEKIKEEFVDLHQQGFHDLKMIMESLALKRDVESRTLGDLARSTIKALVQDKELLLNTCFIAAEKMEDFIYVHSINTAIVSINIATAMGYSAQQIYELSFGAFMHDIGMLRLPSEILMKKGKLSELERSEVFKHPLWALDMLQRLPRIPPTTPLVAYQTHERGDKSGYPRRKALTTIHPYARIVSIADIYCAMIAPRPHRKAHNPYAAMEHMTREVVHGRLDRQAYKAFMSINSLYPVGSWVILSDGRIGKVVGAHPQHYDRPVVRAFFKGTERLKQFETIELVKPEFNDVRVIRSFDSQRLEIGVMEGF